MSDAMSHRLSGPVQVKDSALTQLISRLEAATSRLEDIASSAETLPTTNGTTGAPSAPPPSGPLPQPPTGQKEAPKQELPQSIEDFDTLLNGDVKAWTDLSRSLGGVIAEQVRSWSAILGAHSTAGCIVDDMDIIGDCSLTSI